MLRYKETFGTKSDSRKARNAGTAGPTYLGSLLIEQGSKEGNSLCVHLPACSSARPRADRSRASLRPRGHIRTQQTPHTRQLMIQCSTKPAPSAFCPPLFPRQTHLLPRAPEPSVLSRAKPHSPFGLLRMSSPRLRPSLRGEGTVLTLPHTNQVHESMNFGCEAELLRGQVTQAGAIRKRGNWEQRP